jgi:hypothetical protein
MKNICAHSFCANYGKNGCFYAQNVQFTPKSENFMDKKVQFLGKNGHFGAFYPYFWVNIREEGWRGGGVCTRFFVHFLALFWHFLPPKCALLHQNLHFLHKICTFLGKFALFLGKIWPKMVKNGAKFYKNFCAQKSARCSPHRKRALL